MKSLIFFVSFSFCPASRLAPDFEALGHESLNLYDSRLKLHQAAGPMSVKVSFYFLFFSWLASRLGLDYEALGNESLNCVTLVEAPPGSSPCEYERFNYFFHFSFGLHHSLGQIMKLSVSRA
jgi:hypothetical protein